MFKRNIDQELMKWKEKKGRKPLVLRGARQTGKTTTIREFAKKFKNFVELNLEIDSIKKIFSEVKSIKQIIQSIEGFANQRIIPGQTLIFLDEIQNSAPAVSLLRYFYEEIPDLHVISAGSLLEVRMKKEGWSFPVGRVEFLYLYPATFIEFLGALKEDVLLDNIINFNLAEGLAAPVHGKIVSLLADYMTVGGMPEAVNLFQTSGNIITIREHHEDLSLSFKEDFVKYSKASEVESLKLIWDKVPFEIGNRIKYSRMAETGSTPKKISEAFNILREAMLVERIFPTVSTTAPLVKKAKAAPKALFLDIGLAASALNLSRDQIYERLLNPVFDGGLFEALAGQELLALEMRERKTMFFWTREEKGASSEVDYLILDNNHLYPIEVKRGSHGSLKSMHQFLFRSKEKIGVKIYNGQAKIEDLAVVLPDGHKIHYKLLSLPFYLVSQIKEILNKIG